MTYVDMEINIDTELYEKLEYISRHEKRSIEEEIVYLINKFIDEK